jgi:hypothetical protein
MMNGASSIRTMRRTFIKNGHDVRYVEVYPSEFISFCSASERKCNLEALEDFALKKGLGPD